MNRSRMLAASVRAALEPGELAAAERDGREMARLNVPRMPDAWIADGIVPTPGKVHERAELQAAFERGFADEAITVLRRLRGEA